jgi:hypothetical protein
MSSWVQRVELKCRNKWRRVGRRKAGITLVIGRMKSRGPECLTSERQCNNLCKDNIELENETNKTGRPWTL